MFQNQILTYVIMNVGSVSVLDGPAIRNVNRGDSHESIRRKKKKHFQCS